MRTHQQIIADAGGPAAVHRSLGLEPKKVHAVFSWNQRDRIPDEHWRGFAEAGLASLEELAEAAAARKAA